MSEKRPIRVALDEDDVGKLRRCVAAHLDELGQGDMDDPEARVLIIRITKQAERAWGIKYTGTDFS